MWFPSNISKTWRGFLLSPITFYAWSAVISVMAMLTLVIVVLNINGVIGKGATNKIDGLALSNAVLVVGGSWGAWTVKNLLQKQGSGVTRLDALRDRVERESERVSKLETALYTDIQPKFTAVTYRLTVAEQKLEGRKE